jgi:hypothetical protein
MKIKKVLKAYFEKRQEKKCMSKQYALEKACVDYFNKCVPRVDDITELADNIPIGRKGLPLLVKSNSNSYPLQAVKACIPFEDDNIQLYYGYYPYLHTPERVMQIKDFPSSLWLSVEEFPRPTCPTLLLCDYGTGHYEVVEYANKTWVTELCFPVKPKRYFVLDFLNK